MFAEPTKSFSGKLHTVAGEWASIPITSDKDLFDRMVSVGMIMANVEKKTFNIEETMITKLFGSKLLTDFQESEIHSYNCTTDSIELLDNRKRPILVIPVAEEVLKFDVSGYNVIREWLKYHSYSYYRKACGKSDLLDLLCLIIRILEYNKQVKESDIIMRDILIGQLVKPIHNSEVK